MRRWSSVRCRITLFIAAGAWVGLMSILVRAAPPAISHLFPAGAQRGTTTTVTCSGEFDWPVDVVACGVDVHLAEEKGELQITVPRQLGTDRAWLRLFNKDGASQLVPFLVGNLPETREVEPNDLPIEAQKLADSYPESSGTAVTINGVLEKNGDVDAYVVPLSRGDTLVAALTANSGFGSPMDAILQIVSPGGTVLAENHDDVGLDPRLAFTALESGQFVVRVFAFPATPDQRITFKGGPQYVYRLTLTTGPYITHTVPMSAPREHLGTVEIRGWNIPPGARMPVVPLGRGCEPLEELAADRLTRNGDALFGFVTAPGWAGFARVRLVVPTPVNEIAKASQQEPQLLSVPSSVVGCIREKRQRDHFRLPLSAEQPVSIHVEALSRHSHLVPRVRLFDPHGDTAEAVPETGAAQDAFISHTAAHDGDYLLTVSDRYRHGGERYFYRLSAKPRATDFELSLKTDALVVTSGTPLEVPVTLARQQVVKKLKEIQVEVLDLPAGVTSMAVVSQADGDTASSVTLKLESNRDAPYSGWIRIRGSSAVAQLQRFARTPETFGACFDRVWLTVVP